jgi:hypothetical protein
MYFQREAAANSKSNNKNNNRFVRDKINTGVFLVNLANSFSRVIFEEAKRIFEPKKGGDQTAIQRVLRWYVDDVFNNKNNNNKNKQQDGPNSAMEKLFQKHFEVLALQQQQQQRQQEKTDENTQLHLCSPVRLFGCEGPSIFSSSSISGFELRKRILDTKLNCNLNLNNNSNSSKQNNNNTMKQFQIFIQNHKAFDYNVFEKQYVNAGVLDHQRKTLFIHHAHMSGQYKKENLIQTFRYKYLNQTAQREDRKKKINNMRSKSNIFAPQEEEEDPKKGKRKPKNTLLHEGMNIMRQFFLENFDEKRAAAAFDGNGNGMNAFCKESKRNGILSMNSVAKEVCEILLMTDDDDSDTTQKKQEDTTPFPQPTTTTTTTTTTNTISTDDTSALFLLSSSSSPSISFILCFCLAFLLFVFVLLKIVKRKQ